MMEIREIQTFVLAARKQSFSAAAKELGYSQAAVTIQIRNLEQELSVRLFDRLGRQVMLTAKGKQFYTHAIRILQELDSARDAVTDPGELTGSLSIGAIESISSCVFPELMREFHRRHPRVTLRIYLDSPAALLDRLRDGALDLVYLLDQPISDPRLVKYMDLPEEIIFVTAPQFAPAAGESLTLDELLEKPFLLTEKDASYRSALDIYLSSREKSLEPFLEIGNTDFIVNLVKGGAGYTFLPRYAVRAEIQAGTLSEVPVRDFSLYGRRQLFCHRDKWISREMQAFCDAAAELAEES